MEESGSIHTQSQPADNHYNPISYNYNGQPTSALSGPAKDTSAYVSRAVVSNTTRPTCQLPRENFMSHETVLSSHETLWPREHNKSGTRRNAHVTTGKFLKVP
ncbi:hypothetical protein BaRGS_00019064 [Batillaria attramentaria]|uniref:Uncharacterized protein n=1 Tax=Batillaria attramentaria TaxID=370345 RepID=A0ABD0KS02_9CAEN